MAAPDKIIGKKERRRAKILELLASTPLSTIGGLAEVLNVSDETIRQDLKSDSLKDRVMLAHGSVALRTSVVGTGVPFSFRKSVESEGKAALAKLAAKLIEPGQSVVIEHSAVGSLLAEEIIRQSTLRDTITLITNSFPIMNSLMEAQAETRVIFLGGRFVPGQLNTYGPTTVSQLSALRADIGFLSPAAVDEHLMVTGYIEEDVEFKRAIERRCEQCVLFLEQGKLGNAALLDIEHAYDYDTIVTNARLNVTQENLLEKHRVRVERLDQADAASA